MKPGSSSPAAVTDGQAVVLAVAAWSGVLFAPALPLAFAAAVGGAAWWSRRVGAVIVAAFVIGGAMASFRESDRGEAVTSGTFEGEVEVVTDPVRVGRGVRLDVVHEHRRYEVVAFGPSGAKLRDRLVGQRVAIVGSVRPVRADTWAGSRGVVGSITAHEVTGFTRASGIERMANAFRQRIERGSRSMAVDDQALFLGIVYGDDRNLSLLVDDDFRAAGLTHLVAVSGQNVAFVLLVAEPLLRRFGPWGRWATVLGVLLLFGTVTRFEPSVVRATAMSAVAATATALGRETSATRTLSLAVTGLVLFDPSLVHQLGFRLSVAATAGILWISPPLSEWIPGPKVFRQALGVTAGAQLAVAPMLVLAFGSVPVASIPANLLAGPASAPVMIWGLTTGVVAGFAPEPLAAAMHWPTAQLTGWLRLVARIAAQAPLGQITLVELIGGGALVVLCAAGGFRRLVGWIVIAGLVIPSLGYVHPPDGRVESESGIVIWRRDAVVVELFDGARIDRVLPALRDASVGDIDVLILTTGSSGEQTVADAIDARHRVGTQWEPQDFREGGVLIVDSLLIRRSPLPQPPILDVSPVAGPS